MKHEAVGSSKEMADRPKHEAPNERTPMLPSRPPPLEVGVAPQTEDDSEMPFWQRVSSPLHPVIRKVQDHCHYEWVAALLSFLMLLVLFFLVFYMDTPPVPEHCVTPFGKSLGESNGVIAFSNCNRDYRSVEEHFLLVKTSRVYSGFKWRSVEYVRRFWLLALQPPAVFSSVRDAEDIWTKVESASLIDGRRRPLLKYANMLECGGARSTNKTMSDDVWAKYKPRPGDLLVYANDSKVPGGHVAVIVGVNHLPSTTNDTTSLVRKYSLFLAEQNWENQVWLHEERGNGGVPHKGAMLFGKYSRKVILQEEKGRQMMCVDDPMGTVLGWVRV